ncbi:hypothetical protein [Streptomyces incanus]|uniref:MarR family transcriptional regulator n=1 Tax=Streptomyces incanus TaxID=887453 RepID=A0ABW0XYG8_9ACTN
MADALAEEEEILRHRAIGLEQDLEALAEQEAPAVAAPSGPIAVEKAGSAPGREPRRPVACRESGVSMKVLGRDYRWIMEAFDSLDGTGLTARQVAVHLGWDTAVASRVEGARGRLKRLVERGRLREERPGLFTLPAISGPGPAAAAA